MRRLQLRLYSLGELAKELLVHRFDESAPELHHPTGNVDRGVDAHFARSVGE